VKNKLMTPAWMAAAIVLGLAGQASAQGQAPQNGQYSAPPVPKTKIAVVNIMRVVKMYDKWKAFEEEYKQSYKVFDGQFEQFKTKALALKAEFDRLPKEDPKKDAIGAQLREIDRKAQDVGEEAKRTLGKKNDDMTVVIYREIREAVTVYARANALDLVMHYNDGITPTDIDNPQNVQRKLQAGPLIPIYAVEGLDITDTIAYMLNQRYKQAAQATPAGGR